MSPLASSRAVFALAISLLLSSIAAAQTPLRTAFTYQGQLKNAGAPANGTYNLTFALFDAVSAGMQQGSAITVTGVIINGGLFTVTLNAAGEFGNNAFNGQERWLEVTVNGTTLAPRQKIAATPYALQTRGILVDAGGNVGVGTSTPTQRLDVHGGSVGVDGDLVLTGGNPAITNPVSGGRISFFSGASVALNPNGGGGSGNVGIWTSNPQQALDVNGTAQMTGFKLPTGAGTNRVLTSDANGVGTWQAAGGLSLPYAGTADVLGAAFSVTNSNVSGISLFGSASAASGATAGVKGQSASGTGYGVHGLALFGRGVYGLATGTFGNNYGGYFQSDSTTGRGVYGVVSAATGTNYGGYFQSDSTTGRGVYGVVSAATGTNYGGYFQSPSTSGTGVFGLASATGGITYGVYGASASADGFGGFFTNSFLGVGLRAESLHDHAIYATSYGVGNSVVFAYHLAPSGANYGVYGQTSSTSASAYGVYSEGNFGASGTKNFRIDHPFKPENKYLLHYSAEGPEPLNVYTGNVVTDGKGVAWVKLPNYFEEINRDFRYTLTVVDDRDSDQFVMAKVAREVVTNRFKIRTNAPNIKVSWRVEGIRNDRWVQKYGAPVEVDKERPEKGTYQHPELYGQPPEKGMNYDATREPAKTANR